MDFSSFSNSDLALFQEKVQALHTGCKDKIFLITESFTSRSAAVIAQDHKILIQDERFNDLLWRLSIEAHNELCRRYSRPVDLNG